MTMPRVRCVSLVQPAVCWVIALQLMHSLLVQVNVKDAGFNALMAKAAAKLNLCAHFVGPSGSETLVHAAADLEGHRGTDGRYVFVVCVCVAVCGCVAVWLCASVCGAW